VKHAFITGVAGFVGRHMERQLEDDGWHIYGCDIEHGSGDFLTAMDLFDDMTFDLIVHAAAAGPNRRAIDAEPANFPYNVILDAALFEWAIRTKQRHVVYLSSSAVYSNELRHPTLGGDVTSTRFAFTEDMGFRHDAYDSYGETKRMGERMAVRAREAGVAVTVVRPFSGYGEDQSEDFPFGAFVGRALRGENPFTIWGSAYQVRDFIHIDDVCQAIMKIVESGTTLPVNICTGRPTTMLELAKLVCREAGYVPAFQVDKKAPLGVNYRVGDPTRLQLHHVPTITLEEGVRRAVKLR